MSKIIYNLVYNRKRSLNKKGMALVQVEAYLDRKKKYFSTKVYLKPEQWDNKKLIVKNHPNADALNRLIYEFMAMIEKKSWNCGSKEGDFIRVTKGCFEHKRKTKPLLFLFLGKR